MVFRGDRLRQVRDARGLTQNQLADLCDIGHVLIYRYENSVTEPSFRILTMLATKLEVRMDYLAGLTDDPQGHFGDRPLADEELAILTAYQTEGWSGILRLGAERIAK